MRQFFHLPRVRRILGIDEVMPLWVAMQYGYCSALGLMSPASLDNDRYSGIQWTGVMR